MSVRDGRPLDVPGLVTNHSAEGWQSEVEEMSHDITGTIRFMNIPEADALSASQKSYLICPGANCQFTDSRGPCAALQDTSGLNMKMRLLVVQRTHADRRLDQVVIEDASSQAALTSLFGAVKQHIASATTCTATFVRCMPLRYRIASW